jgi:tRNA A-37 threonylcarbamoyl transferase component Bud32
MKEAILMDTRASIIDFQSLENDWKQLCAIYLPISRENSFWRFSCERPPNNPEQGWKLHVSATILSASKILAIIGPFLTEQYILFKAPSSLLELKKINCGLFYGFSQVGKCFAIYPQSTEQAVSLAWMLDSLTEGMLGPAVPYDLPLRDDSCVYYRYGAFGTVEMETSEGKRVSAIRTPGGELYPDRREPGSATPNWVKNPFVEHKILTEKKSTEKDFLQEGFLAYEAISQRGKGGVYRALDLNARPARLCILKEGRKYGEVDIDGRDGYWRVKNEAIVLSSLASAGVNVPEVYKIFEVQNHCYVAIEHIGDRDLQTVLLEKQNKITIREALSYGIQTARLLDTIHNAGWVWRDCKPHNLLLTGEGTLRPIDFEGACPLDDADLSPWGTTGYHPPEWLKEAPTGSRKHEDLYALGATLHQLFSGRTPVEPPLAPIGSLRRHIPPTVRKVISFLLHENPNARPDAHIVAHILESALISETLKASQGH